MKRNCKQVVVFSLFAVLLLAAFCLAWSRIKHTPSGTTGEPSSGSAKQSQSQNTRQNDNWNLVLVNRDNPIQSKTGIELTTLPGGEKADKRICPALTEMTHAAKQDGIEMVVVSGYRTEKEQKKIYRDKIKEYLAEGCTQKEAEEEVKYWVSLPGRSEHELGIAVDLGATGDSTNDEVYAWLKENAHLYGFIFRYPPEKSDITGIANEPWHYRYVGKEAAAEIFEKNITLEEYLEKTD